MEQEKRKIYLGLDVSTQCIGISIVIDDGTQYGNIVELNHICPKLAKKTNTIEDLFIKKEIFENYITENYLNFGITDVVIEEPLLRSNNVNTVATLLRFNGMISESIYKILHIVPQYISSHNAREYAFPDLMAVRKYNKKECQYSYSKIYKEIKNSQLVLFGGYPWGVDKKIIIQEKVSEIFPSIKWLYKKNGELRKENYDACDAYVAVLGYMHFSKYGELNYTTEIISETEDNDKNTMIKYNVYYWNNVEPRTTYINKNIK